MYDIILFDLDGTLTDPGEGITNSVAYALSGWGITVADRTELYRFIGPPLKDSFMEYYGFTPEEADAAIVAYRAYFRDRGIFENRVYDGIEELLKSLKAHGKTVALATSKPEEFARRILVRFGLDGYFDLIAGATMDSSRSRKGDVIAYALESLETEKGIAVSKAATVMVGDRRQDIRGAKENGLDSIGVLFGYGDRTELETAGATHIAPAVEDILSIIMREGGLSCC